MSELKEKYTELKELYKDSLKIIRERDLCIDIAQKENQKLAEKLDELTKDLLDSDEVCFKAGWDSALQSEEVNKLREDYEKLGKDYEKQYSEYTNLLNSGQVVEIQKLREENRIMREALMSISHAPTWPATMYDGKRTNHTYKEMTVSIAREALEKVK